MEFLHRLIIGLAIALAHVGQWPSSFAIAPPTPCACTAQGTVCLCTDCPCEATPTDPDRTPAHHEGVVTPSPRVSMRPDRVGIETLTPEPVPPLLVRFKRDDVPAAWLGEAPFASWCVWRT